MPGRGSQRRSPEGHALSVSVSPGRRAYPSTRAMPIIGVRSRSSASRTTSSRGCAAGSARVRQNGALARGARTCGTESDYAAREGERACRVCWLRHPDACTERGARRGARSGGEFSDRPRRGICAARRAFCRDGTGHASSLGARVPGTVQSRLAELMARARRAWRRQGFGSTRGPHGA